MSQESPQPNSNWSPQNMVTMALLVVVIILLAANLFKEPTVQVVTNEAAEDYAPPPRNPSSKDGRPEVDPYVANQVKNRITKGYTDIRDCWNAYVDTNPSTTEGRIKIDWTVKADGSVTKPEIVTSDFADTTLTECMIEKIKDFEFPPPPAGRPKYVAHTFFLQKDTGGEEKK